MRLMRLVKTLVTLGGLGGMMRRLVLESWMVRKWGERKLKQLS